jgi:sec-independent protein translocase protein TatA
MFGDLFDNPWKILIVAVVIIVLFGSRKLPDAARSLGRSMRILKTEVQGMHEDDQSAQVEAAPAPAAQLHAPAQQAAAAPGAGAAVDTQAQIDALQKQLSELQQQAAK